MSALLTLCHHATCNLLVSSLNAPPTPETYTLSLHDALPICDAVEERHRALVRVEALGRVVRHHGNRLERVHRPLAADRKSTRLNSSHRTISYAVFCLKKKNPVYIHTTCHILVVAEYTEHSRH